MDSAKESIVLDSLGAKRLFQPDLQVPSSGGNAVAATAYAPVRSRRFGNAILRQRIARSFEDGVDLTVDLGDNVGSGQWWLGLAALASLCGATLALGSRIVAIPQSVPAPLTPVQRETLRPLTLSPLARGGATGVMTLPNIALVEPLNEAPERPRLEMTARLGGRDSFESALRRAGVGQQDVAGITALVRPVANLAGLDRNTELDLVLGRRETRSVPRPLESLGFRAAFDLKLAVSRVGGTLQLKRVPITIDNTPLRITGSVGGNIERSLRAAGIPAEQTFEFIHNLGYAVDFQHGVGRRDRFDIIVDHQRAETGEQRFGALRYAGLERSGKEKIELARFDFGGKPQFFRPNGEGARKGLMRTPVDGAHLTSGFGMRFHPLLEYTRMHQGVDFGAPMGSPVMAAANGTISFAGSHGGHGNYIMVKHNAELATGYAHLSRFAVRPGQQVSQGQVIGYVGSTGLSTGPHLHYEVWLRGAPVNPVQLRFVGGTQLAGGDMARFRAELDRLRRMGMNNGVSVAAAEPAEARGRGHAKARG